MSRHLEGDPLDPDDVAFSEALPDRVLLELLVARLILTYGVGVVLEWVSSAITVSQVMLLQEDLPEGTAEFPYAGLGLKDPREAGIDTSLYFKYEELENVCLQDMLGGIAQQIRET